MLEVYILSHRLLLENEGNNPLALFESTKHKSQPTTDDSWLVTLPDKTVTL